MRMPRTTIEQRGGRRRNTSGGYSLVELAVLMPLLALLLVGAIDLGRIFIYYTRLTNAVREGALYAQLNPDKPSETVKRVYAEASGQLGPDNVDFVINSATDIRCYQGLTSTLIATPPTPGNCSQKDASGILYVRPGDSVEVTARYTFHPITTQIIRILPPGYTIKKSIRTVIQ